MVSAPAYAEHVLLENWQNYIRKGQAVKRIALSLGNGIISSNGELWVNQRRMIQPAFNRSSISDMAAVFGKPIPRCSSDGGGRPSEERAMNVTRDVSLMVLEITLTAIFGTDYDEVAPDFAIVAEESRNLEFAQTISSLGKACHRDRRTSTQSRRGRAAIFSVCYEGPRPGQRPADAGRTTRSRNSELS